MKASTFLIAFGPMILPVVVKTIIEPMWIKDYSFAMCIAIGAVMGLFSGFAVRILEPRNSPPNEKAIINDLY